MTSGNATLAAAVIAALYLLGAGLGHLRELLLYGCLDAFAVLIGGGDAVVVALDALAEDTSATLGKISGEVRP